MSIQSLTSAPVQNGVHRDLGQTSAAGASFQELMEAMAGGTAPEGVTLGVSAEDRSSHAAMMSALNQARFTILEKMKLGKEKEEEEEAWDELMEYVDTWIESLREEGDIEKSARAYAAVEARKSKRPAMRRDTGDWVMKMMTEALSDGTQED